MSLEYVGTQFGRKFVCLFVLFSAKHDHCVHTLLYGSK